MYLYSSVSKKIRVSPSFVSYAEYVVGGSDDDRSYFPQGIIQVLFIDINIIAHGNERVTRFPKNT